MGLGPKSKYTFLFFDFDGFSHFGYSSDAMFKYKCSSIIIYSLFIILHQSTIDHKVNFIAHSGATLLCPLQYSRSTADHDALHPVGETVGKQAGHVIVHDLHLTALELSHLMQADLVLLGILQG